jgi:hypothetical protein
MGKKRKMNSKAEVLAVEAIARVIHVVHGHRVMLDSDLAFLYGVETRAQSGGQTQPETVPG